MSVHGALSCTVATKIGFNGFHGVPFVGRLIDKEVQELPRPPAPALSPGYAPLIKHIQTVTLYCQDAADGLASHFNHKSASRPEARVAKSAGVLGPVSLHSGERLFGSGHAYFQLRVFTIVLSALTQKQPLGAASRIQGWIFPDPSCKALTSIFSVFQMCL